MKYVWVCLAGCVVFYAFFVVALSHFNPVRIETTSQHDVLLFDNPEERTLRYGELAGYPHMYEFSTRKEMTLAVSLAIPDGIHERNDMSGIILSVNADGSVTEVARLRAREASWETFYEPFGGDTYRRGGAFSSTIPPGLYRIEVSTPDNIGFYALFSGTEPVSERKGYSTSVQAVYMLKTFFGKSGVSIVGSPFIYAPGIVALFVMGAFWYLRAREQNEDL